MPGIREFEVRNAGAADLAGASAALAAAFADDPAWRWVLPSGAQRDERQARLERFFDTELATVTEHRNEVWVSGEGAAAAVWAPPGHWQIPLATALRTAPAMARVFGARLPWAARHQLRAESLHPRRPPHWYLHYLGAEPLHQGRGLGSALMWPVLELCDREGIPAYLEASTERNRALYERNGFEVVGTFRMPGGGPLQRRMWRKPRA
ncbi:MAG: GNAT family N-acetyltransferase [Actinomycetota bacterium]